jgi:hypothetical protein
MITKQDVFEYFLFKLIGWHCEENRISLQEFNDHNTNDFSKLKIIKLHFFACSTNSQALDYFNNFYAMPYGHVESTVYSGLNELNFFSVDNFKLTINNLNPVFAIGDEKTSLVDNSVNILREKNPEILALPPFDLVELSHKWFSWQYTFNEARKEYSYSKWISPELIKSEAKFYSL